jgi:hypothetical protein
MGKVIWSQTTKQLIVYIRNIKHHQQPYLRQSVQLCGLGTSAFDNSLTGLIKLHEKFRRYLPEGNLTDFQADTFQEFQSLNISTRYFTSRFDNPDGIAIAFQHNVDPNNILASFPHNRYFHSQDNQVLYYQYKAKDKL